MNNDVLIPLLKRLVEFCCRNNLISNQNDADVVYVNSFGLYQCISINVSKHRSYVDVSYLCVLGLWLREAVRAGLCWLPSRAGLVM